MSVEVSEKIYILKKSVPEEDRSGYVSLRTLERDSLQANNVQVNGSLIVVVQL